MRCRPGIPSTYALRILASVFYGLPPRAWARGQAECGGSRATLKSCVDRGMLTADHQLTDYGRRLLELHGQRKPHATA